MEASHCYFALLFTFLAASALAYNDDCVYTIYIRTGSIIKGGTDSSVSLTLGGTNKQRFYIPNPISWGGAMWPGHDYFERGNLDVFTGRGPCGLTTPICSLNLTTNGKGEHPGWYCDYVEVTFTGPDRRPCSKTMFEVKRWLALDAAPYKLYANLDGCSGRGRVEGIRYHTVPNDGVRVVDG